MTTYSPGKPDCVMSSDQSQCVDAGYDITVTVSIWHHAGPAGPPNWVLDVAGGIDQVPMYQDLPDYECSPI